LTRLKSKARIVDRLQSLQRKAKDDVVQV
jgi:hypothetical protein